MREKARPSAIPRLVWSARIFAGSVVELVPKSVVFRSVEPFKAKSVVSPSLSRAAQAI